LLQGESHCGSPPFDFFHNAKSAGDLFPPRFTLIEPNVKQSFILDTDTVSCQRGKAMMNRIKVSPSPSSINCTLKAELGFSLA